MRVWRTEMGRVGGEAALVSNAPRLAVTANPPPTQALDPREDTYGGLNRFGQPRRLTSTWKAWEALYPQNRVVRKHGGRAARRTNFFGVYREREKPGREMQ